MPSQGRLSCVRESKQTTSGPFLSFLTAPRFPQRHLPCGAAVTSTASANRARKDPSMRQLFDIDKIAPATAAAPAAPLLGT
jgi:hypothetical protein